MVAFIVFGLERTKRASEQTSSSKSKQTNKRVRQPFGHTCTVLYVHTNSSLIRVFDPGKEKKEIRAATVRITLLRPTSHGRIVLAAIG